MLNITNFKKFSTLSLPLGKDVVITGKSGTGKTQILWAYLLFFKAFNGKRSDGTYPSIHLKSEAMTLLDPRFTGIHDYTSFLNKYEKGKGRAEFEANFPDKNNNLINFKVTLHAGSNFVLTNGSLLLYSNNTIQFAYMKSSYLFTGHKIIPSRVITSCDNSLRYRYYTLNLESHDKIHTFMESTFGTKRVKDSSNDYILFEVDNVNLDIMFLSVGVQKVFAALILLYCLIETPQNDLKYYLMDDIETDLDENVVETFYKYLLDICKYNSINLIVTSRNSNHTFSEDTLLYNL